MPHYKIHRFQIKNFRNLQDSIFEFGSGINCILGKNGNGKTNLLEAIYFLFMHKSFKKSGSFTNLLAVDTDEAEILISAALKEDNEVISYSGKIGLDKQEWYLSNKLSKKKIIPAPVFINPFDSYQFFNSSQFRKDTFDEMFCNLDETYSSLYKKHKKYLKMRNFLLSHKPTDYMGQIRSIDQNLAPISYQIIKIREQLIAELNNFVPVLFKQIFSAKHRLIVSVQSKWEHLNAESIYNFLQEQVKIDSHIGFTKYTTHKDDYLLLFDDFNAIEFCSLGQQKMSYLSLLFAYIELFRYKFKAFPLLLLDDLSGELDETRWKLLVQFLNRQEFQVLITSANEKFREELDCLSNVKNFLIESGNLVQSH